MLFLVIGPPGRLVRDCADLAIGLVRRAFGPAELINADTLDEIGRELLLSGASHAVVAADHPGGGLKRTFSEIVHPFIVVLEDPRLALARLVVDRAVPLAAATRIVASSCTCSRCFFDLPGALVLAADQAGSNDPHALAAAIAQHLELDLAADAIAQIVGEVGPVSAGFDERATAGWWDSLDPAERAMAAGALGIYLDPAAQATGSLSWAPSLFFVGDQSTEPLSGSIDITGRARCLLHGPQIMLPPGNWTLTASFDFSIDAADHNFVLEVIADATLSRSLLHPPGSGVFEIAQSLTIDDLPDRPIELRLSNEKPAFGGELTLLSVTLIREAMTPTNAFPRNEEEQ